MSLRLLIYDATCTGRKWLSYSWWTGAHLYSALGRFDAHRAVSSWEEALLWLGTHGGDEPIAEIQYWGHGRWGNARVQDQVLDIEAFGGGHEWRPAWKRIASRLSGESLWWFRTCETFGACAGHTFSRAFAETLGCRVAGHTFIIGPWQSGLHSLVPGADPDWDPEEGVRLGTAERPVKAAWSTPFAPNTVSCLAQAIPAGY